MVAFNIPRLLANTWLLNRPAKTQCLNAIVKYMISVIGTPRR